MESKSIWNAAVMGLAIGLGMFLSGLLVGNALVQVRAADRYVTVKGLAEREVPADLAFWPITFKVAGHELAGLQRSIDAKRKIIERFLLDLGFDPKEITYSSPTINDNRAQEHIPDRREPSFRYIAQATVLLRSGDVARIKSGMEQSATLVGRGVVLVENWENRSEFLFTGLNQIKPAMIEEATRNARQAAEKFAQDSGSRVGKIRTASQGLFSIEDRDRNTPDLKTVRVVTTVQYFLVDR